MTDKKEPDAPFLGKIDAYIENENRRHRELSSIRALMITAEGFVATGEGRVADAADCFKRAAYFAHHATTGEFPAEAMAEYAKALEAAQ